ncbi:MAG: ribbon-helix-helix domain-containing protein [Candidatus Hodarchaeales archaeon]
MTMKIIQVKFPEDLINRIDKQVNKIKEPKGPGEIYATGIHYDPLYNRSKFIREACEEKMSMVENPDEVLNKIKLILECKLEEKDFQNLLLLFMAKAITRAAEDENFNLSASNLDNFQGILNSWKSLLDTGKD